MSFDLTVRITDIVMLVAVLVGPILAVQVAEFLRNRKEARERRHQIFRGLMSTRSATLSPAHIESLNVVDVEFHNSGRQGRRVVDSWKLYLAHLNDRNYPRESWDARRADLLNELLYEMATALGYSFDKSHIKGGTYYPHGYEDSDQDNFETRKLMLQLLRNQRAIFVTTPPIMQGEEPPKIKEEAK